MFSDNYKNHIICNYAFSLFESENHNMNKTRYGDFHTYTEANSEFILSEEQKASNTNKTSDTKKSKDNSNGATNAGNNKYKYSK